MPWLGNLPALPWHLSAQCPIAHQVTCVLWAFPGAKLGKGANSSVCFLVWFSAFSPPSCAAVVQGSSVLLHDTRTCSQQFVASAQHHQRCSEATDSTEVAESAQHRSSAIVTVQSMDPCSLLLSQTSPQPVAKVRPQGWEKGVK